MTTSANVVPPGLSPSRPSPTATAADHGLPGSGAQRWMAQRWMWGFLPAFLVHDGEEALSIVRAGGMRALGRWETPTESLAGMVLEFTLGWLLLVFAAQRAHPNWATWSFAVLIGGWTVHGLGHLASSAMGGGNGFGDVTALPAAVCYGALTLRSMMAAGLLTRRGVALCLVTGPIAAVPLITLAHLFGRLVG